MVAPQEDSSTPSIAGVREAIGPVGRGLADGLRPPGLSVAAVTGDGGWTGGFGLADVENGRPVAPDTVFLWFSMTKIVTATAVVQLAERGALSLDDRVGGWVPHFPSTDRGARVTVRHLLDHSAGLANPIPVGWVHPADAAPRDPHELTARLLAKHSRLRAEPGRRASYSNLGYLVLGDIVEAAAGQSYPAYVRDQILVPLGMASTDFMYRPEMVDRAATGYHPRHHPLTPLLRRMVPDGIFDHRVGRLWAMAPFLVDGPAYGGLVGTVEDAATFLRLHLGADDGRSRSVLSLESVAAMQRRSARGRKLDVALGWFRRGRDREADVPFWEHLGGGGGFWNVMRIYPQLDAGVVGMGNCTAWDHRRVTDALIGA